MGLGPASHNPNPNPNHAAPRLCRSPPSTLRPARPESTRGCSPQGRAGRAYCTRQTTSLFDRSIVSVKLAGPRLPAIFGLKSAGFGNAPIAQSIAPEALSPAYTPSKVALSRRAPGFLLFRLVGQMLTSIVFPMGLGESPLFGDSAEADALSRMTT